MLQIEIFSDVVCPWCFIGKRRLDRALAGGLGEGATIRWRPYQLQPNIPVEGVDRMAYLTRRYGDQADASRAPKRIVEEAAGEGIEMRYDLIRRMPNTLQAHRLLEYAFDLGCQHELAEALFNAYFCEGRDVGDLATLCDVAEQIGLERQAAERFMRSDAALEEVRAQLARAPEVGVSGVPGYYLADSFLLPGAQTSETMEQIISRVKEKIA